MIVLVAEEKRDLVHAVGIVQMHVALAMKHANASANKVIASRGYALRSLRITNHSLRQRLHVLVVDLPLPGSFADHFFLMIVDCVATGRA